MDKSIFILASKSPRRKELLSSVGINAEVIPADIDEDALRDLPPNEMVRRLALLKATSVARSFRGKYYVIGADTCVCLDGEIFGKPKNSDDAKRMLLALSGKEHSVYTGYCVVDCKTGISVAKVEKTAVKFRNLTVKEAEAYIKTREPMDKAGSYGIQNKGSIFVEKIDGDYFNVVGLPLCALTTLLRDEFGVDVL